MKTLLLSLLLAPLLFSQSEREADVRGMVEIRHKQQRGEALTAEEAESVKRIQSRRQGAPEAFLQANPPRDSTGLVPLPDLGGGQYKGERGGLYPDGANAPPPAYLKAGRTAAAAIAPLDAEGKRAVDGQIVLLSLGMSNTTQSFQAFQKLAAADAKLNPRLVIVDGAQGANSAEVTANPASGFWLVVDERLKKAGVTPRQVQAVWMKQAFQMPTRPFPTEAKVLYQYLVENVRIMRSRFSNLKIVYLSSRTYGGWARTPLNPEPHAYEGAFSVKWLIGDRIAGKLDGPLARLGTVPVGRRRQGPRRRLRLRPGGFRRRRHASLAGRKGKSRPGTARFPEIRSDGPAVVYLLRSAVIRGALLAGAFLAPAGAQHVEARATLGYSQFGLESLDAHLAAGGGLRFYLTRRLSVEPELLYLHNGEFSGRAFLFQPNVAFDFTRPDARGVGYVIGSVGFFHYRNDLRGFFPATFPLEVSTTGRTWSAGAGVKVFLTERLFFSPEARIGVSREPFLHILGSVGWTVSKRKTP